MSPLIQYGLGAVAAIVGGLYLAYRHTRAEVDSLKLDNNILNSDKDVAKQEQKVADAEKAATISLEEFRRSNEKYKNERAFFGLPYGVDNPDPHGGDGGTDDKK